MWGFKVGITSFFEVGFLGVINPDLSRPSYRLIFKT